MSPLTTILKHLPTTLSSSDACSLPHNRVRSQESLLFTVGFSAFVAWLLLFPQIAVFYSNTVFQRLPWSFLPFVIAFCLFALLARSRKLPKTHITATVVSVAACVVGFVFIAIDSSTTRFASFIVMTLFAAYLLVVWGSLLRNLTAEAAFSLVVVALAITGAFRFLTSIPCLFFDVTNIHAYYSYVLVPLVLAPFLMVLYFSSNIPSRESYCEFSKTEDSGLYLNLARGELFPFALILFAGAVLTSALDGFIYMPYRFDQVGIDLLQGLTQLGVAALAIVGLWQVQRGRLAFASLVTFVFLAVLLMTILALLLTAIGHGGMFVSQGMLKALGDIFFLLIVFFAIASANNTRANFFSHFFVSVLCSGLFWAFALGSFMNSLMGSQSYFVTTASVIALVVIATLFIFATLTSKTLLRTIRQSEKTDLFEEAAGGKAVLAGVENKEKPLSLEDPKEAYEEKLATFNLSRREHQVALLILEGLTTASIAHTLGISLNTAKGYVRTLYKKCDISSKPELFVLLMKVKGKQDD